MKQFLRILAVSGIVVTSLVAMDEPKIFIKSIINESNSEAWVTARKERNDYTFDVSFYGLEGYMGKASDHIFITTKAGGFRLDVVKDKKGGVIIGLQHSIPEPSKALFDIPYAPSQSNLIIDKNGIVDLQTEASVQLLFGNPPTPKQVLFDAQDEKQARDAQKALLIYWHPDKNPEMKKYATVMMNLVNKAYESFPKSNVRNLPFSREELSEASFVLVRKAADNMQNAKTKFEEFQKAK